MELLSEVKPASCSKLDELLSNLRATLMALPATEPVDVSIHMYVHVYMHSPTTYYMQLHQLM